MELDATALGPNADDKALDGLEDRVKKLLKCERVELVKRATGGYVNKAGLYMVDGQKRFIKLNGGHFAETMFKGERAALDVLRRSKTFCIPEVVGVYREEGTGDAGCGDNLPKKTGSKGVWFLVEEAIDPMEPVKDWKKVGELLGELHTANPRRLRQKLESSSVHVQSECVDEDYSAGPQPISEFGFPVDQCYSHFELPAAWRRTWPEYFVQQILSGQIRWAEGNHGDREVLELWSTLVPKLDGFFKDAADIQPSLLHGDVYEGNMSENDKGIWAYDPACMYGDPEYDLRIPDQVEELLGFGEFPPEFWTSYRQYVPESRLFKRRLPLYVLVEMLNIWNHEGQGLGAEQVHARERVVRIMGELLNETNGD